MCLAPSSLTSSPELWTRFDPALTGKFSDRIILFSANPEQETTGPRVTIPKVKIPIVIFKFYIVIKKYVT